MGSSVVGAGPDDAELVRRFRGGEGSAFAELVKRYRKPIYNVAYRLTANAQDASEVAQSVFLRVLERIEDYDPSHRFFSWIYRIAINEAIDVARRNGREEPLEETFDAEDGAAGPQEDYERRQSAARVRAALGGMSPDDRAVLTLRHYAECDYRDMALILGIEEKTVKSRLFEARRRLALRLQALGAVRP